jgi:hypothetical protein
MTPVEIKLYQTASEPTMVEKTLVEKATVTGYFKQVQDITAPVIDLAFNDRETFNLYFNSNYAYIALFNRYYFISRKEVGMNNILSIYMDEDVLMSFKEEIYNLVPLVTRQATDYDNMLIDSNVPVETLYDISFSSSILYNTKLEDSQYIVPTENFLNDIAFTEYIIGMRLYSQDLYQMGKSSTYDYKTYNGRCFSEQTYFFNENDFISTYLKIVGADFTTNLKNWFSNFSNVISECCLLPINLSKNAVPILQGSATKPIDISVMGAEQLSIKSESAYACRGDSFHFYCTTFKKYLLSNFDNFFDILTDYIMLLPYVGEVKIDTNLLFKLAYKENNKYYIDLYVYYITNLQNFLTTCYITNNKISVSKRKAYNNTETGEIVYQYSPNAINYNNVIYKSDEFRMGNSINIGGTNFAEMQRNSIFSKINAKTSMVSLFNNVPEFSKMYDSLSDKRLSKTGKKYQERSSAYQSSVISYGSDIIGIASNSLQEIVKSRQVDTYIRSTGIENFNKWDMTNLVYIKKISPIPKIPSNYYELYGGVCNLTVPLSTLKTKGYTKCANVHMTGFTNATSEEIAEIESLLLSGVIL